MANTYKQLAQARENSTNTATVYTVPASTDTIVRTIIVCNTSEAVANVEIYIDDNGSTYDETTAIVWNGDVPEHGTLQMDGFYAMGTAGGTVGYRSSVANALTITLFGLEMT